MSLDKIVAKRNDVVDRQLCGSVRLHHGSLINGFLFLGHSRFNGQQLNIDIGAVHSGKLLGETPDVCRLNTESAHKAGHLDASLGRKVVDKSRVQHVAADAVRRIGDDRLHNAGGIFP